MSNLKSRSLLVAISLAFTTPLLAGDDPIHERHELMEGVGDAAKPIGQMLKGEREFDATGAETVVTSCSNCRINLMIGADNAGWKTPVTSLAETVASRLAD